MDHLNTNTPTVNWSSEILCLFCCGTHESHSTSDQIQFMLLLPNLHRPAHSTEDPFPHSTNQSKLSLSDVNMIPMLYYTISDMKVVLGFYIHRVGEIREFTFVFGRRRIVGDAIRRRIDEATVEPLTLNHVNHLCFPHTRIDNVCARSLKPMASFWWRCSHSN